MYVRMMLGSGGVFFGASSFGFVTRQWPNTEVMRSFVGSVSRQRPVSSNGVVFSLGSVLTTHCRGNIVLLIQPELHKG
jgi:hypothetical protein